VSDKTKIIKQCISPTPNLVKGRYYSGTVSGNYFIITNPETPPLKVSIKRFE
jgi:hypothetical protein